MKNTEKKEHKFLKLVKDVYKRQLSTAARIWLIICCIKDLHVKMCIRDRIGREF